MMNALAFIRNKQNVISISIILLLLLFYHNYYHNSTNKVFISNPINGQYRLADLNFTYVPLPPSFAAHYSINSGVPLSSNALNWFYSSFQCLNGNPGDFHTEDSWPSRQCIFHNVCLRQNGSSPKYIIDYFYPSSIESLASTSIRSNNTFLALRHGARYVSGGLSTIDVQPIPMNHQNRTDPNSNLSYLDDTYLIYQILPDGDMNFGHVIFDDAFGLFANLKQFRATRYSSPKKNHVLVFRSCSQFPGNLSSLCHKFTEGIFPVITSHQVHSISSLFNSSVNSNRICFRELVAGHGSTGAVGWGPNNFNRAEVFSEFRSKLLLAHGINPNVTPQQHHIMLVNKTGKRRFNNINEIYRKILATPRYSGIKVTIANDLKNLSITQQLALFQTVTVAVSPCGGISLLFFVLPRHSTLIVSSYPQLSKGVYTPGRMEAQVWDFQSHLHVIHYPVNASDDFTLSLEFKNTDWAALRNHANINLKVDKLFPLIDQAIITATLRRS
ncbi:unnamed protein product [Rotaria magnacalcarata]|uniref:Uncharacterized protein n=1 Tax=Rotaria magnacalcarata TaxID=392030 RepID=A0A816DYU2_9BILA|nr:unnamed protein product [Rotaria magnacalcarata]